MTDHLRNLWLPDAREAAAQTLPETGPGSERYLVVHRRVVDERIRLRVESAATAARVQSEKASAREALQLQARLAQQALTRQLERRGQEQISEARAALHQQQDDQFYRGASLQRAQEVIATSQRTGWTVTLPHGEPTAASRAQSMQGIVRR